MTKKHLVIGDSHSKPGVVNTRYERLGRLIQHEKPDVIVNIGDHADMASLCSYDRGTKGFEGRRYKHDINAAIDASEKLEHYGGQAWRDARKIMTVGNHENRINRAVENQAELEGVISVDDLKYEEFYDEVHEFNSPVVVDGISYCHYHVSGVMGRPIGGEHPAYQLIAKKHMSCTVGHSHLLDYCRRTDPHGRIINGLAAGCYFEHDEAYAGPANQMYWRGIVVCDDVSKGDYDLRTISMAHIKRAYS